MSQSRDSFSHIDACLCRSSSSPSSPISRGPVSLQQIGKSAFFPPTKVVKKKLKKETVKKKPKKTPKSNALFGCECCKQVYVVFSLISIMHRD